MPFARSRLLAASLVLWTGLPALADEPPSEPPSSESVPSEPVPDEAPPALIPTASDAPARGTPEITGSRYAFAAGGVLLLGGLGFGYFARGDERRARALGSASEAEAALSRARTGAATANVLYGLAGATLLYGLVLELLPEPAAEKASLTFHF